MRCAEYVGIADDFDRQFNHPKQPEFSRRFLPRDAMLCVCLSRVEVLQKGLNIGLRKQRCTIAQGIYDAKDVREIRMGA